MPRLCTGIVVAALLVVHSVMLAAQPQPARGSEDIRPLFAASDVVGVGSVAAIDDSGSPQVKANQLVKRRIATIVLERIYKGSLPTSAIRLAFYEAVGQRSAVSSTDSGLRLVEKERALLFLQRGDDAFEFTDPWFSKLEISPYVARSSSRTGLDLLEADLEAGLDDVRSQNVLNNLEVLGGMQRINDTSVIRRVANGSDNDTRAAALLALLKLGDYSLIDPALHFIDTPIASTPMRDLQRRMALALQRCDSSTAVPSLLRYSDSSNDLLRASVVKALRRVADPRSANALARRLSDPISNVRYDAMFALATISDKVNPEWLPGLDKFKQHEAEYLAKWRQWWVEEGQARYAALDPLKVPTAR